MPLPLGPLPSESPFRFLLCLPLLFAGFVAATCLRLAAATLSRRTCLAFDLPCLALAAFCSARDAASADFRRFGCFWRGGASASASASAGESGRWRFVRGAARVSPRDRFCGVSVLGCWRGRGGLITCGGAFPPAEWSHWCQQYLQRMTLQALQAHLDWHAA